MVNLTLEDISRSQTVTARRDIYDVPTGRVAIEIAAKRDAVGEVCDVDFANGVVFVDFGHGAIACTPDELR